MFTPRPLFPSLASIIVALALPNGCSISDSANSGASRDAVRGEDADPHDFPGVVALCDHEDTSNCPCSGVLLAPDVVVTARHMGCSTFGWVVAGRRDLDGTDGWVGRVLPFSSCRAGTPAGDDVCAEVHATEDLDILRLETHVPSTVALPARIASPADIPGHSSFAGNNGLFAVGYGGHANRRLRATGALSRTTCPSVLGSGGVSHAGMICVAPDVTETGDSGGPLFVRTLDGEMAIAGILSHGHPDRSSDYELLTQITTAHRPLASVIPGDQRPSTSSNPSDPSAEPAQWVVECIAPVDPASVRPDTVRIADFTGDGIADIHWLGDEFGYGLYMLDTTGPDQLYLSAHPALMEGDVAESAQSGNFFGAAGSAEELVWLEGTKVHVGYFAVEPASSSGRWLDAGFPSVDISAFDNFWGGSPRTRCGPANDYYCGDPRLDPLLRVGDLNGDTLDDAIVIGEDNFIVLENVGGTHFNPVTINIWPFVRPAFSETLMLGDVASTSGEELVVRGDCGLEVYSFTGSDLELLWRQPCESEEYSFNESNGFLEHGRWIIGIGELGGSGGCADILLRGSSQLLQLTSSCSSPLTFVPSAVEGANWQQPFHLFSGWGREVPTPLLVYDINNDGLDDVVSYTSYGLRARTNSGAAGAPWASLGYWELVGGKDQINWSPDLATLGNEDATVSTLSVARLWASSDLQLAGLNQLESCWSAVHLP